MFTPFANVDNSNVKIKLISEFEKYSSSTVNIPDEQKMSLSCLGFELYHKLGQTSVQVLNQEGRVSESKESIGLILEASN